MRKTSSFSMGGYRAVGKVGQRLCGRAICFLGSNCVRNDKVVRWRTGKQQVKRSRRMPMPKY